MPKEIHRDALFATIFTFVGIWLLQLVLVNIHFLDPLDGALKDFDLTDILYSRMGSNDSTAIVDTNIVLINLGSLDRKGIADMLDVVRQHEPAVVGLDATFKERKDPVKDSLLKAAMAKLPNLVTAGAFEYADESTENASGTSKSNDYFGLQQQEGYTNFIVREEHTTVRYYPPIISCDQRTAKCATQDAFTSKVLKKFSQPAYEKLLKRKRQAEMINYSGKLENFIHFNTDEIYDSNPDLIVLKGKIVLISFLDDNGNEPTSLEDLHFTPYNPQYAGRSFPDMYGGVIHANILTMALHGKYINTVNKWLVYGLAFLLCWAHMYFFLHMYVERHIWFHVTAKLVQLATSTVIVLLALFLLGKCQIKLDSTVLLVPIILCVDLLYFYEALVKSLHKHFGHKTYLMKEHHE